MGLPHVQVNRINKSFSDGKKSTEALKEISFTIDNGERIALLGPSGCGKTTLLRIIAGLTTPTSGDVSISGSKVIQPSPDIGIVFQEPALLPWRNMLDNISLPLEILGQNGRSRARKMEELVTMVGLNGFEKYLPYEMSGGMQQRVSLCRALIHSPSLLVLDEPFGALDAMTREQLNFELLKLQNHFPVTTLLVTHSIPEAILLSDRVILMGPRPGSIVATFQILLSQSRDESLLDSESFRSIVHEIRQKMKNDPPNGK